MEPKIPEDWLYRKWEVILIQQVEDSPDDGLVSARIPIVKYDGKVLGLIKHVSLEFDGNTMVPEVVIRIAAPCFEVKYIRPEEFGKVGV